SSRLFGEASGQLGDGRQQLIVYRPGRGDMHGRGEAVVGALRAVDVIVRVHRTFSAARAAGQFVGTTGNHLVDVHVALGAAASLPDHQRELFIVLTVEDLVGSLFDQAGHIRRQITNAVIHPCRGFLD